MRIAHCSDPHLLSLAGVRGLDFANKRWIGGLDLLTSRARHYHARVFEAMVADFNRQDLDHVMVTGDITNVALEEEFRFARGLFDAIRLGPDRVTVLPGNHDAYVARGAGYFSTHFHAYHRPDPGWEWDGWPVVRVRGPLAVIALSTSLVTPWFRAWGLVGTEQLARLRTALADPRLEGLFRLVAIHHPPAGPGSGSRVRGLRDRDGFADVIAAAGAELVLHGHQHLDVRAALPAPDGTAVAVRGIQSATYESGDLLRRARYRVYEIDETAGPHGRPALVRESVHVWHPVRAEFTEESTVDFDVATGSGVHGPES